MPLAPLLQRIWELRENLTAYDAARTHLTQHNCRAGNARQTADLDQTVRWA